MYVIAAAFNTVFTPSISFGINLPDVSNIVHALFDASNSTGSVTNWKTTTKENKIIPTLKAVLSLEITEKYATVDMGAINFVIKGADIMSPGIVDADKTIVAGETIVIIEETHKKPIAIGTSLISGEEMIENSKGKAIENLHYVGDTIWDLKI